MERTPALLVRPRCFWQSQCRETSGPPLKRDRTKTMPQNLKFRSHMLREIFEQPDAVLHTVLAMHSADAGYSGFDGMSRVAAALHGVKRIVIAASGTSRHAGIAGKEMLESMTIIPVEVEYA